MNKHLIQFIKNSLILVCLLSLATPAGARMSIRRVEHAEQPACSSFLLITDTPVILERGSDDDTRTFDLALQGLDIHEELEPFFSNDDSDSPTDNLACITSVQTSWIGMHRVQLSFTPGQGLTSMVESDQTRVGQKYHTLVHVYTESLVDNTDVEDTRAATLPINKPLEIKKPKALRVSIAVMADTGDVLNTGGDFDDEDLGFDSNFEVRRARITAKGRIGNWLYKTRLNVVNLVNNNDNDNEAKIDRAYIGYTGWKVLELRIGLQPEPFGLEKSTSSKYISFMERSLLDTFTPEDNLGILAISRIADPLIIQLGAYVERPYPDGSKTDKSVTGRIFYDPIRRHRKLLHLGVSYSYREPLDNRVRYKERPEAHLAGNLFKSDRFQDVDWTGLTGLEAAYLLGPVSLQAEYVRSSIMQDSTDRDRDVDGYYAYVSWFLTGESRPYSNGNFGRIRPGHSVGKPGHSAGKIGWGAWELALRYSVLKDDEDQQLADITYALNWYLTKRTRFMLNWVHTDYESDDTDGQANIGQVRLQQLF